MTLGRNLLAGFANAVSTTLIGLVVVPLYIRHLGVEAYGLIGFSLTTQAALQVLDLGLAPTLAREVARSRIARDPGRTGRLLHTLAMVYWGTAAAIGVAFAAAAPAIARGWIQSRQLSTESVAGAMVLIGLIIATRWPSGAYLAALMGAERLTIVSGLGAASAVCANLGGVFVIAFVSPTVHALFIWQAMVGIAYALLVRWAAWRVIGRPKVSRFDPAELRSVWRFSAGMMGIGAVGLLSTQVDKVLLSRVLGLDDFGRYMVATTVAGGLYLVITPVFNSVYPRFSRLVAGGDVAGLAALYGTATRLLAAGVFPLAMLLVVSGEDLVLVWTGNAGLARSVAPTLALLAAGTALHGVMYLPYALQLAYGETRLALRIALILMLVIVPLTLALALAYGAIGGGMAWFAAHLLYVIIGTWMTHRRLLEGTGIAWLTKGVGVPLAISAAVGAAGYQLLRVTEWTPVVKVSSGVALAILASALCVAASPQLANAAFEHLGWRKPPEPPGSAPLQRIGGS